MYDAKTRDRVVATVRLRIAEGRAWLDAELARRRRVVRRSSAPPIGVAHTVEPGDEMIALAASASQRAMRHACVGIFIGLSACATDPVAHESPERPRALDPSMSAGLSEPRTEPASRACDERPVAVQRSELVPKEAWIRMNVHIPDWSDVRLSPGGPPATQLDFVTSIQSGVTYRVVGGDEGTGKTLYATYEIFGERAERDAEGRPWWRLQFLFESVR